MSWKKNPASGWKLYCIIDSETVKGKDPAKTALALFKCGVKAVQLRYKNRPSHELTRIAKKIRKAADKYGASLLINDRIDVALASGAAGVHLGRGDMPLRAMRYLSGPRGIAGKTVHSVAEAEKVKNEKINYVGAGPVFFTPLKKKLKKKGPGFIAEIKKRVSVPVFAIGGINARNARKVIESGADGICVTRAIFEAPRILKKIKDDSD